MRKLKNQILLGLKRLRAGNTLVGVPRSFLHKDVPYFSQWESPGLNRQILDKSISASDNPSWKDSGAETKEEYLSWSWAGCGMACLKMVLAKQRGKIIPLVVLGKKCAEYGGYSFPLEESTGLLYKPFVKFAEREFSLRTKVVSPMILQEIIAELGRENFVIASVSPQIRDPESTSTHSGGHLVLILGYDLEKKELYLHNPSGYSKQTQEYAVVSFRNFKKFFAGRGIVIKT